MRKESPRMTQRRPGLTRQFLASLTAPVMAAVAALGLAADASAQLRVVNYNGAKFIGNSAAIRSVLAETAFDDKPGFAVAPAIIAFQEVPQSSLTTLAGHMTAAFPGVPYARATYTTASGEDGAGGAQCVYYRTDLLSEVVASHVDISTGASRNTDRWLFQLVGYSSTAARFYLYSSHLKASNTSADASERNSGAIAIRNNADALGANQHIIYLGDYNLYTNTEAAYVTMTAAGNGRAFDPIGGSDWTGSGNALKHTQSPRDITADGLVGGAMDDRFDFQLSSSEFQDSDGLSIIAGTYRAFGNDGQHYNLAINAGNNFYFPGNVARSNALADALFAASDHIPLIVDYRVPGILSANMQSTFGQVIVGASVVIPVQVPNAANVVAAAGAAPLSVTVTGSNGLFGTQTVTAALAPGSTTVNLALGTSTPGAVSGLASISSPSEGVQNATTSRTVTGTVLAHARPSWSGKSVVTTRTVSTKTAPDSGVVEIPVSLHNFGYSSLQARLDCFGASGLSSPFSVIDAVETNVAATPTTLRFGFNSNGRAPGVYEATATIAVGDEDLPGGTDSTLTLNFSVTVSGAGIPGDLDGNGVVNGADLAILLGAWGTAGPGDLNNDGVVNGADLAVLLGNWG